MTKRFLFQVLIGAIFFTLNISKDIIPFGKMYLKIEACQLNIDKLLRHKSLSEIESMISNEELNELKRLKNNYCK